MRRSHSTVLFPLGLAIVLTATGCNRLGRGDVHVAPAKQISPTQAFFQGTHTLQPFEGDVSRGYLHFDGVVYTFYWKNANSAGVFHASFSPQDVRFETMSEQEVPTCRFRWTEINKGFESHYESRYWRNWATEVVISGQPRHLLVEPTVEADVDVQ